MVVVGLGEAQRGKGRMVCVPQEYVEHGHNSARTFSKDRVDRFLAHLLSLLALTGKELVRMLMGRQ